MVWVMREIQRVWNQSDTEMYCKDTEEHWDHKGATGRGVQWPFGDLYYVYTLTTRNIIYALSDTFKSCNLLLLSFMYKNMWPHTHTKICDPTHTHTHTHTQICDHTHTDTNYETGHIFHHSAFLLTDQHLTLDFVNTTAQCMCVCVCAHMQTSESDKRRLQADSWQSASTSFHVIQCKHCMKYENKISWAQAKSCPSYFRL